MTISDWLIFLANMLGDIVNDVVYIYIDIRNEEVVFYYDQKGKYYSEVIRAIRKFFFQDLDRDIEISAEFSEWFDNYKISMQYIIEAYISFSGNNDVKFYELIIPNSDRYRISSYSSMDASLVDYKINHG